MSLAGARSIRSKLNFIVVATTLAALLVAATALVLYNLRQAANA